MGATSIVRADSITIATSVIIGGRSVLTPPRQMIRDNVILYNDRGIVSTGASLPIIQDNMIFANLEYGLENENNAVTIDARYNWWGDASGPYHLSTNPFGLGNPVSDYVNYHPWITIVPTSSDLIIPGIGGAVFSPDGSTSVVFASDSCHRNGFSDLHS